MSKKAEIVQDVVAALVDEYAKARLAKTAAEKEEARLRKQLLDQFEARGQNRLEGEVFEVTRSTSSRDMLDGDSVRRLLTPAQIEAVTKTVPVTNLSVVRLNEVVMVRAA
jgi:citrate lyase synthetase